MDVGREQRIVARPRFIPDVSDQDDRSEAQQEAEYQAVTDAFTNLEGVALADPEAMRNVLGTPRHAELINARDGLQTADTSPHAQAVRALADLFFHNYDVIVGFDPHTENAIRQVRERGSEQG